MKNLKHNIKSTKNTINSISNLNLSKINTANNAIKQIINNMLTIDADLNNSIATLEDYIKLSNHECCNKRILTRIKSQRQRDMFNVVRNINQKTGEVSEYVEVPDKNASPFVFQKTIVNDKVSYPSNYITQKQILTAILLLVKKYNTITKNNKYPDKFHIEDINTKYAQTFINNLDKFYNIYIPTGYQYNSGRSNYVFRKLNDVDVLHHIFCDIDLPKQYLNKDYEQYTDNVINKLSNIFNTFNLYPTIMKSNNGIHIYFHTTKFAPLKNETIEKDVFDNTILKNYYNTLFEKLTPIIARIVPGVDPNVNQINRLHSLPYTFKINKHTGSTRFLIPSTIGKYYEPQYLAYLINRMYNDFVTKNKAFMPYALLRDKFNYDKVSYTLSETLQQEFTDAFNTNNTKQLTHLFNTYLSDNIKSNKKNIKLHNKKEKLKKDINNSIKNNSIKQNNVTNNTTITNTTGSLNPLRISYLPFAHDDNKTTNIVTSYIQAHKIIEHAIFNAFSDADKQHLIEKCNTKQFITVSSIFRTDDHPSLSVCLYYYNKHITVKMSDWTNITENKSYGIIEAYSIANNITYMEAMKALLYELNYEYKANKTSNKVNNSTNYVNAITTHINRKTLKNLNKKSFEKIIQHYLSNNDYKSLLHIINNISLHLSSMLCNDRQIFNVILCEVLKAYNIVLNNNLAKGIQDKNNFVLLVQQILLDRIRSIVDVPEYALNNKQKLYLLSMTRQKLSTYMYLFRHLGIITMCLENKYYDTKFRDNNSKYKFGYVIGLSKNDKTYKDIIKRAKQLVHINYKYTRGTHSHNMYSLYRNLHYLNKIVYTEIKYISKMSDKELNAYDWDNIPYDKYKVLKQYIHKQFNKYNKNNKKNKKSKHNKKDINTTNINNIKVIVTNNTNNTISTYNKKDKKKKYKKYKKNKPKIKKYRRT